MKVFLNAGHHLLDPGAWHKGHKEGELTIELRDAVINLFTGDQIEFESVPDDLDLKESIAWVNERADVNDTAFSIHFNANSNPGIRGTEAYYFNEREKELAEIYSRNVSSDLHIPNRGAKPDKNTWVGSLGWLRKLKCDSVLIEVCYLSNDLDMSNYDVSRAARGIVDAVKEIIPRKDPVEATNVGRTDADLMNLNLSLLQELFLLLTKLIELLKRKSQL